MKRLLKSMRVALLIVLTLLILVAVFSAMILLFMSMGLNILLAIAIACIVMIFLVVTIDVYVTDKLWVLLFKWCYVSINGRRKMKLPWYVPNVVRWSKYLAAMNGSYIKGYRPRNKGIGICLPLTEILSSVRSVEWLSKWAYERSKWEVIV